MLEIFGPQAREQYRQAKYQRQVEWAVGVIQRFNRQWKVTANKLVFEWRSF
jgi:hypothetical protein